MKMICNEYNSNSNTKRYNIKRLKLPNLHNIFELLIR